MPKQNFYQILTKEIDRIEEAQVAKRHEVVIQDFTDESFPKALIDGKKYAIFNSNDYLGLRHHPNLKKGEKVAGEKYGTGPGAVRFISGSLKVHTDLEKALAKFHKRQAAIVFSSAFAANLSVLFCLIKGQNKDSLVPDNAVVISDELNHRSIIDGIRLANLPSEQRAIFKHLDSRDLGQVLSNFEGKYDRAIVVSDGVFSMLGEYQDLAAIRKVINQYDSKYPQGILLIVDDAHGVASFGKTGRGTEEQSKAQSDVLIGTLGKGFGADGGYVVGDRIVIDYLRESGATYIYSNSISPGTAGAALESIKLVDSVTGTKLFDQLDKNVKYFKAKMTEKGFKFAAGSIHPIQALLIADPVKTMAFKEGMYEQGILVTNINYPVVPKGKDEIRVQISAAMSKQDLDDFIKRAMQVGKKIGIV